MSNRTPTPWLARPSQSGDGIWIGTDNENAACVPGFTDHPHNIDNAAFIVKAANCHDALVAAVQKVVNNWGDLHHKDLMQLRAALAQAESTS